jgi:hypothetical protein
MNTAEVEAMISGKVRHDYFQVGRFCWGTSSVDFVS